jgi:hypothetical protein
MFLNYADTTLASQWRIETMGSFNTSFVFTHTWEAKDVSAYDLYIYAKGIFKVGFYFLINILFILNTIHIRLICAQRN